MGLVRLCIQPDGISPGVQRWTSLLICETEIEAITVTASLARITVAAYENVQIDRMDSDCNGKKTQNRFISTGRNTKFRRSPFLFIKNQQFHKSVKKSQFFKLCMPK